MTIVLCMCIQGETLIKYYLSIYLSTNTKTKCKSEPAVKSLSGVFVKSGRQAQDSKKYNLAEVQGWQKNRFFVINRKKTCFLV